MEHFLIVFEWFMPGIPPSARYWGSFVADVTVLPGTLMLRL